MDRTNPENAINRLREVQQEGVSILKISNFEAPIHSQSPVRNRYHADQKFVSRRQYCAGASNRDTKMTSRRDRKVRSSQQVRPMHQLYDQLGATQGIADINRLSPLLKEKINQLRNLMYRRAMMMRRTDDKQGKEQNIHFTQYVMNEVRPAYPGVLHSRNTKNSPFMKSIKAKRLMSKSLEGKKIGIGQNFKSIEVNKESKYAPSRKIVLHGGAISSRSMRESRNFSQLSTYSKTILGRSSRQNLRKKAISQLNGGQDQCRGWDIQHMDHLQQDHHMHFHN